MKVIVKPTDEQFATFGKKVAALLGTQLEWSGGDCLEDIGSMAVSTLHVQVGDQDDALLNFWRGVADEVGIEYEADEDDEWEDEDE